MDEEESSKKKGTTAKRKKNPLPKDPNAPKRPTSAYFVFCADMLQKIRTERPDLSFSETSRHMGSLWANLPPDRKQRYTEAAEKDRERYLKEFTAYQQTDAYKQFMIAKQAASKAEREEKEAQKPPTKEQTKAPAEPQPPSTKAVPLSSQQGFVPGTEIPIFSEQFLHHNRDEVTCSEAFRSGQVVEMESELRKLRLTNIDLEEENALLSRHVENMRTAVGRLQSEIDQQQTRNADLKDHLRTLREVLLDVFHDTPLPGTAETPTLDTIDSYIGGVQVAVSEGHSELVAMARKVAERLQAKLGESQMETDNAGQTENDGAVS